MNTKAHLERIAVAAAVLLLACGGDGEPAPPGPDDALVARDSAGVAILEAGPLPVQAEGPEFRLSAKPAITIGVLDGPEEQQLFRVTDAARLSDGRIVVANAGSGELRFFDARGAYLFSAGGKGDGPGEFAAMAQVLVAPGDTLHVSDFRLPRMTVFDAAGRLVRTVPFDAPKRGVRSVRQARLASGEYVRAVETMGADADAHGIVRNVNEIHRYRADGKDLGTIFTLQQQPTHVIDTGSGASRSIYYFPIPFETEGSWAAHDAIYAGTGETYEIRTLRPDGSVARILRRDQAGQIIDDDLADALAEDWKEGPYGKHWREISPGEPFDFSSRPKRLPVFDGLLLGEDGALWVRRFPLPGVEAHRWDVHASDGRYLGMIMIPGSLTVRRAGADYLLATRRTDLDIEQVVLFELSAELDLSLTRPPPPE